MTIDAMPSPHDTSSGATPDLDFATVAQQRDWVATGTVTARQLVEHSLARIDALDDTLNAFAYVLRRAARREADLLDVEQAEGALRGPLHGVPVAIKDENDVAGLPTAYGGGSVTTPAPEDSEVVRRLRAAGAIIIGKTRMPEFGIWPFTETSAHGWTRNPWDILHSTAGSSGGSAAAVASGMVAAAIGGDGGGSIRLPSSWCGLFGLKAQRGRSATAPNPDLWKALGVLGPLTRTVLDSALINDVIRGAAPTDRFDAGELPGSLEEAASTLPAHPLRIQFAVTNPMGGPKADALTLKALHRLADWLTELGHEVRWEEPDYPKVSVPFTTQVAAGVAEEASRVEHPDLLERRTRGLVRLGRLAAHRVQAAEAHAEAIANAFLPGLFASTDILITPTTPGPAQRIGRLEGLGTIGSTHRAGAIASYTAIWNVLGNPAAALPVGWTTTGLPLSAQLVGPPSGERTILSLAAQIERAHPWDRRRPDLSAVEL